MLIQNPIQSNKAIDIGENRLREQRSIYNKNVRNEVPLEVILGSKNRLQLIARQLMKKQVLRIQLDALNLIHVPSLKHKPNHLRLKLQRHINNLTTRLGILEQHRQTKLCLAAARESTNTSNRTRLETIGQ